MAGAQLPVPPRGTALASPIRCWGPTPWAVPFLPTIPTKPTSFTTGQRKISRPGWQRRMDVLFVKNTSVTEWVNLKFSFDDFNITSTPSFDVPIDNITQNQYYNSFPRVRTPALPTACEARTRAATTAPMVGARPSAALARLSSLFTSSSESGRLCSRATAVALNPRIAHSPRSTYPFLV